MKQLLTVLVVVALELLSGSEVAQEQIEPEGPGRPFTFTADPHVSTTNCYRVAPNTTVFTFNAGYKGNSQLAIHAISPASVGVLWETGDTPGSVVSDVSYDATTKNVTLTTSNAGNAVIAAYDNADPTTPGAHILWSWHIWVTDYDPNLPANQCVYSTSGATMMDRNLGALSNIGSDDSDNVDDYGLLYQWGRKDPFIGAGKRNAGGTFAPNTGVAWDVAETDAITGTVDYATQHPLMFIVSSGLPSDWHYAYRDNSLWSSTKTLYDPCPAGWRVPNGGPGEWEGWPTNNPFNSTNSGLEFGTPYSSPATWYPAAGFRLYRTGSIWEPSSLGCYWSCSVSGAKAYGLYFRNNGIVNPQTINFRALGLSVRCQKE